MRTHVRGIMSIPTYARILHLYPLLAIAFDKRSTFVLSAIFFYKCNQIGLKQFGCVDNPG